MFTCADCWISGNWPESRSTESLYLTACTLFCDPEQTQTPNTFRENLFQFYIVLGKWGNISIAILWTCIITTEESTDGLFSIRGGGCALGKVWKGSGWSELCVCVWCLQDVAGDRLVQQQRDYQMMTVYNSKTSSVAVMWHSSSWGLFWDLFVTRTDPKLEVWGLK